MSPEDRSPQDPSPQRLNAAIDALIRGVPLAEACADLPPELHPLAAAGARLAALRSLSPDGPRPAFVLALEEQLRADLRLGRSKPPEGDPPGDPPGDVSPVHPPASTIERPLRSRARAWARPGIVTGLMLVGLIAFWLAADVAGPYDALYPARRAIENLRLLLAFSSANKAEISLELGWRRLQDTGEMIARGRSDHLAEMIEDMTTAYTLALTYAEQSDDRRMSYLAQTETQMAIDELARLAAGADPGAAALLGRVDLVLSDTGQGRRIVAVTAPSAAVVGGPTRVALAPSASATSAAPTADTPELPGATLTEPPPPPASRTAEAPPTPINTATALATRPPASATLTPIPSPPTAAPPPTTVVPPPTSAPPPTNTRERPKPPPPPDTATPTVQPKATEDPSRTPKPWATETAPPPSTPIPTRPGDTPDPGGAPPSAEPPAPGPGLP